MILKAISSAASLGLLCLLHPLPAASEETQIQFLSGTDCFNTVDWSFQINGGRRAGERATIPVPSNWELQGFGSFRYSKDWGEQEVPDSEAIYSTDFAVPADWAERSVFIVFGGVMTDATVLINGQQAGPVHQAGFTSSILKFPNS